MKTLIYGAGPIGQWLALKLSKAGKDVTLLARGKTFETLKQNGVCYMDAVTGTQMQAQVTLTKALGQHDAYDLVIVPMVKQSRLAVSPFLADNDAVENILFLGNDVAGSESYLAHLPKEKVIMGFPGAGGGWQGEELFISDRDKPRQNSTIFMGELDGVTRRRTRRIATLFKDAGITVKVEKDIDGWLKYHFAFMGPTAGVIFKHGGNLKAVAKSPAAMHQYCEACREAGNVLAKIGYTRRQPSIFNLYYWLPRWLEPKIFAKLFGSEESEVKFGLHAQAVGPELLGLAKEFDVLKTKAAMETPNLDELMACVAKGQKGSDLTY